jgi:peptidoglycan/LPS O-acetylase OafA/YrhL
MPHRTEYISNLTPLRGIAALLVAVFHFEMAIARFVPASTTMFFEKSYLMVDLFFVMSGFIMFHVYGENFNKRIGRNSLREFIVARFARIYPLHFFTLMLLVFLVMIFSPAGTYPNAIEFPAAIPTNIFLLQSFYIHKIFTWNIPSWSISAECAAYALFPIVALLISRKRNLSVFLLTIFVAGAYLSIMYLLPRKNPIYPSVPVPHNVNSTFDYGFLRGIAGFTTGMLMYMLFRTQNIRNIFQKDFFAFLSLALLIITMHFGLSDGYCIILFAMLVLCLACNNGLVHRVCNNVVLQYLGLISYSIYLMQIFFQEPFSKGLRLSDVTGLGRGKQNIRFAPGIMYCLLYLFLLVGISTLTYYFVENPCRKFINRKWGNKKFDNVIASNIAATEHA